MKKQSSRRKKNPFALNEGNLRRWLFLNLPKYSKNEIFAEDSNSQIYNDFQKDLTGTLSANINPTLAFLLDKYILLWRDILLNFYTHDDLKLREKVWRFYTTDRPELVYQVRVDYSINPDDNQRKPLWSKVFMRDLNGEPLGLLNENWRLQIDYGI